MPSRRFDRVAIPAAMFVVVWSVIRASVQSITIDEATTYTHFVSESWATQWYPTSTNHPLNTALIRLLVAMFGLSHLTMRLPALLGGVLYVIASFRLSRLLIETPLLRLAAFGCLIFNPFVMDYLVAARGYGLALGFLMTGLYFLLRWRDHGDAVRGGIFLGLSVCSNFSFGLINAAVLVAALMVHRESGSLWDRLKVQAAAVGAFVIAMLAAAGSAIAQFPREQLYYGSKSLREMISSIAEPVFYTLNPELVNPLLGRILTWLKPVDVALFGALLLGAAAVLAGRRVWQPVKQSAAAFRVMRTVTGAIAGAFVAHWLAFRLLKIPMPLDRTGIFFVPLSILAVAMLPRLASQGRMGTILRAGAIATLLFGSVFFIGCLRLRYFKQWKFGADVKSAYWVLDDLHRRYGITAAVASWEYSQSLNFYRAMYHDRTMPEFQDLDSFPPGACAYVVDEDWQSDVIAREHLQIYYRAPVSTMVIAVRPLKPCMGAPSE